MNDPRDDPVNLFLDQWRNGGAKRAIINSVGTKHIPETHYGDAMRFRSEERSRYESLKEMAAFQEAQMTEAATVMQTLMGAVSMHKEENSKLREERDVYSQFIVDNASALRGRASGIRVSEATDEAGGALSQGGESRTGRGRPGATGKRGPERAEPLRGHERPGGAAERRNDEEDPSSRETQARSSRQEPPEGERGSSCSEDSE